MCDVRYVAIANAGEMPVKPHLRVVAPSNENRTVPVRRPNAELRTREHLTPAEIDKLIAVAKRGRYGQRDTTLILVAYRHGLRATEVADLEWSQVEWGRSPALHVRRAKNGKPAVHPIRGDTNCACCANCSGIRRVPSCSRPSGAGRSPPTPSTAL